MSVHATKDYNNGDLFIYMFTNRKEQNNKQSPIEVEVFKWGEDTTKELDQTTERRYLKDFILENNKSYNDTAFYTLRQDSKINSAVEPKD